MQGKRVYKGADGVLSLREGEYGKDKDGVWHGRAPGNHAGNLQNHSITEFPDGTITVEPSIKITTSYDGGKTEVELWHGHLIKGVWSNA